MCEFPDIAWNYHTNVGFVGRILKELNMKHDKESVRLKRETRMGEIVQKKRRNDVSETRHRVQFFVTLI